MNVRRLPQNPIIYPEMDESVGTNINGPSLIRVPDWVPEPLGRYYLYFAHHHGAFIRLAYADGVEGPWRIYAPGTLRLDQTPCYDHIASPDAHVDTAGKRIILYYHGFALEPEQAERDPLTRRFAVLHGQRSLAATSADGLHFTSGTEILGSSYFRVFFWSGSWYALGMPGVFFRSPDGLHDFEAGPALFGEHTRHVAVKVEGDTLYVLYSTVGDCPEQILLSRIELAPNWLDWQASPPIPVLWPEADYEGADLPLAPSARGSAQHRVRQVRDPCLFEDGGRTYLLYSVAGESGIAIAEVLDLTREP